MRHKRCKIDLIKQNLCQISLPNFFNRSLTGLNSEFFFSYTSYLTKAEEPSLPLLLQNLLCRWRYSLLDSAALTLSLSLSLYIYIYIYNGRVDIYRNSLTVDDYIYAPHCGLSIRTRVFRLPHKRKCKAPLSELSTPVADNVHMKINKKFPSFQMCLTIAQE